MSARPADPIVGTVNVHIDCDHNSTSDDVAVPHVEPWPVNVSNLEEPLRALIASALRFAVHPDNGTCSPDSCEWAANLAVKARAFAESVKA